jgi:glycosyltransferase involved in cell wall biosynthesis
MATSSQLFARFLDWISDRYQAIPLEDLVLRLGKLKKNGKQYCSITFDDGWLDTYLHAFPLLRERQLPATVFVPTCLIGTNRRFWQERLWSCLQTLRNHKEGEGSVEAVTRDFPWCPPLSPSELRFDRVRHLLLSRPTQEAEEFVNRLEEVAGSEVVPRDRAFMNWEEVRTMQSAGIGFGSHTLNHVLLTRADPETMRREIESSRHELVDRLGAPVNGFSYPWGRTGMRIRDEVKGAGYRFAVMGGERLVHDSADAWLLPRIFISDTVLRGRNGHFQAARTKLVLALSALKRERQVEPCRRAAVSRERLRVALVIDSIDSWENGGTEQQIAKLIAALDPAYFAVELYFLRPSRGLTADDFPCPVHVAARGTPGHGSRWATLRGLAALFKVQRPHIVQTFFRDATYYGTVAARMAHVPRVVIARRNFGHWKTAADRWALKVINRLAHAWQCNSRAVWESLKNSEGVPPERIEILPNAIDLDKFSPPTSEARLEARRQLGLPLDGPVFVSVATLFPVKDPQTLVEAAALVRATLSDAQFLLVGEGPLRGALSQRIEELGLGETVWLLGAQADVRPYLAAADIGLLTSRSEGSSNSLLEYMAMGLPAIVSDLPGNRELVEQEFFDPGDARDLADKIVKMWSNPELRGRMRLEYRRRALSFGFEAFARRAQSYYPSLVAEVP